MFVLAKKHCYLLGFFVVCCTFLHSLLDISITYFRVAIDLNLLDYDRLDTIRWTSSRVA